MKVLVVAIFVSCIAAAHCDAHSQLVQFSDECVKEIGIGSEAWEKVEEGDLSDPKMPDYLFCVYKKQKYLDNNGDYLLDSMKAGLTEMYTEDLAIAYIKECTKESYGSAQKNSMHLTQCALAKFPKIA